MKRMNRLWSLFFACLLVAMVTVPFAFAAPAVAEEEPSTVVASQDGTTNVLTDPAAPTEDGAQDTQPSAAPTAGTTAPAAEKKADSPQHKTALLIASGVLCALGAVLLIVSRVLAKRRAE